MRFKDDIDEDKDDSIDPHPIQAAGSNLTTFEGMAVNDLEMVLKNAPRDAKIIIKHLQNPEYLDRPKFRSSFIVGPSGVGKTVLAKAIAHKVSVLKTPWQYEYISSRAFVGRYRNQTLVNLRSYLDKIAAIEEPTVLIIDQLNKILDYPNSAADDTSGNSSVVCSFLDKQEYNENFFFIGIMDRATELSKTLKSRILMRCLFIEEPTNSEFKRIIFTSKCINAHTQLHSEVTNEWLTNFLAQAPSIIGRNFRGLSLQVKEIIEKENQNEEIAQITKNHLERALIDYVAAKKDIEHIDPYEAHEDTLERRHKEKLRQLEELHLQRMRSMEQQHKQMLQQQTQLVQQQSAYLAALAQQQISYIPSHISPVVEDDSSYGI